MDLFDDDDDYQQPKRVKKNHKLDELFEDDSSESASSNNEDADLFEANIDFESLQPNTAFAPDADDGELAEGIIEKKKTTPNKTANLAEIQAELDEKLGELKDRAERLKNKGKDPQKIEKKKESLKAFVIFQTLIMRNPQNYDNFMKLYILCVFSRWHFYTKMCNSDHILAFALSKLDLKDMKLLDKIKLDYAEEPDEDFKDRLMSMIGIMLRNFTYDRFNDHQIMFNLSENETYSYENILQILYALLKYAGICVRIVSAIDLACLNVNKKHFYVAPGQRLPGVKGPVRKRKLEQAQTTIDSNSNAVVEEYKPKLKQNKLNKKSFSSMITSFTTSFVDNTETRDVTDDDFMDIFRDDSNFEYGANSNRGPLLTREEREFESKLSNFNFKPGKKSNESETQSESGITAGQTFSTQSQPQPQTYQYNKAKVHKSNISKYTFGKKNSGTTVGDVDLTEYKFWLEVFDFNQKKWIQVEPLKRRVYDDQEETRKRLHGTAPLFVITFQPYEFKEELKKYNIGKSRPSKNYYVRDVSVNYIERWHKLLVTRRELNINLWWNQVSSYFKFKPDFSNDKWKYINKWEDEYARELERKDIPQNPREFRFSRHYILPSMLKKFQSFYPESRPLEIKFHEEPIYEKSGVCELHSRARWRRDMRQVREGQEPVKKVLSLVGNGEQLVDLFGRWQTEPFENKLREDGSLPKNEYGNYELFVGQLPEGVAYINLPSLPRLCKKLGIDYVEAVSGFEVGKQGRPHAVISGIIAFQKDEEVIREAYEKYKDYIEEKEREKVKKTAVSLWKGVFRKILIKKYILETYQKENQ